MNPYYEDKMVKIYCGRSEEIIPQIDTNVDLVITSPPYPGNNKMWGELYNEENVDDAHKYLACIWDECLNKLNTGGKIAINIANTKRRPYIPNTYYIYKHFIDKAEPLGEIIWDKGYGQCGTAWGSFRSPSDMSLADQHEYILIFRKYGERHKPDEFEKIDTHDFKSWRNSLWEIPPAKASVINHVAPFPDTIPLRLITLYSFAGEIILDPFLGSGTTCYCAKKLGRKSIGIDINEQYCELAAKKCSQEIMELNI